MNFHPTAISRNKLSRPMFLFLKEIVLEKNACILDWGCGRGNDVKFLRETTKFKKVFGYDPFLRRGSEAYALYDNYPYLLSINCIRKWDAVTCIYVLNVIQDQYEREDLLHRLFQFTSKYLLLSARTEKIKGVPFKDGVITAKKTFQKQYTHKELQQFVEQTLKVKAKKLGPGVLLIDKEEV